MEPELTGFIAWEAGGNIHRQDLVQGHQDLPWGTILVDRTWTNNRMQYRIRIEPRQKVRLRNCELHLPVPGLTPDTLVLTNGFQSWTHSQTRRAADRIPRFQGPFRNLIQPSGDYAFFPATGKPGHLHSHTLTCLQPPQSDSATWFLDLQQTTGYTLFITELDTQRIRIAKDCAGLEIEETCELLRVQRQTGSEDELKTALAEAYPRRPASTPVSGWTSWYNYYTDIDEEIVWDNLHAFGKMGLPLDCFQIDDGWQPAVGDWLTTNHKFPKGLRPISEQAHRYGFKAGLWLAPFIADQRSTLHREHPDWFLTYDGEHRVTAGFNPLWAGMGKGRFYALDLYHPEVRDYLRQVFDRVLNEWGFDMVKLDFLYAVALIPQRGRSRGQVMVEAMQFLRESCGEKAILGCGVPLGPAFGLVEYCRIGPDIGLGWDTSSLAALNFRERISTRNALHNAIARRVLGGTVFANDPDVFILREENQRLSPAEQESLLLVSHTFGELVFTSDHPGRYTPDQLRRYRSTFPRMAPQIGTVHLVEELYTVDFAVGELNYRLGLNLGRKSQAIHLPPGLNFQRGKGLVAEQVEIEPHGSCLVLLGAEERSLLGSDGHLFPGADLEEVTFQDGELVLRRRESALAPASVWVRLPPGRWTWQGKELVGQELAGHRFAVVTME